MISTNCNPSLQITSTDGAEAAYVAIRSTSTGAFLLMIDDITLSIEGSATEDLELLSYNVFKDGEPFMDRLVKETRVVDTLPENADQHIKYFVSAYYDKGESKPSNVLDFSLSSVDDLISESIFVSSYNSGVLINGAAGEHYAVYSTDGIVIASGTAADTSFIPTGKGIYLVKINDKTVKIIVD